MLRDAVCGIAISNDTGIGSAVAAIAVAATAIAPCRPLRLPSRPSHGPTVRRVARAATHVMVTAHMMVADCLGDMCRESKRGMPSICNGKPCSSGERRARLPQHAAALRFAACGRA